MYHIHISLLQVIYMSLWLFFPYFMFVYIRKSITFVIVRYLYVLSLLYDDEVRRAKLKYSIWKNALSSVVSGGRKLVLIIWYL